MGDRSNVVLLLPKDFNRKATAPIWLYSHWGGEEFLTTQLAEALEAARPRWFDASYAARIIIRELFQDLDGETGGGVSLIIGDNEHDIVVVDLLNQVVYTAAGEDDVHTSKPGTLVGLDEYVKKYAPAGANVR